MYYCGQLYPSTYLGKVKPSSNIYIIDYEEGFTFRYISIFLSFTICWLSLPLLLFLQLSKKIIKHFERILEYIKFYLLTTCIPHLFLTKLIAPALSLIIITLG